VSGALPLLAVLATAVLLAWWYRRAQVRVTATAGTAAALVVYTVPGCTQCGPARRVADEVAAARNLPVHVIDLAETPVAGILRAPTTLVHAHDGAELARFGGIPDPRTVAATLDRLTRPADRPAA
jgi:hypothetical protein